MWITHKKKAVLAASIYCSDFRNVSTHISREFDSSLYDTWFMCFPPSLPLFHSESCGPWWWRWCWPQTCPATSSRWRPWRTSCSSPRGQFLTVYTFISQIILNFTHKARKRQIFIGWRSGASTIHTYTHTSCVSSWLFKNLITGDPLKGDFVMSCSSQKVEIPLQGSWTLCFIHFFNQI